MAQLDFSERELRVAVINLVYQAYALFDELFLLAEIYQEPAVIQE